MSLSASWTNYRIPKLTAMMALVVAVLLIPALASAGEYSAARKFGRGLAGIVTGFLEIPGNIVRESRENGVAQGATVGLAKGLGMFVARELVGVYEVLTAPFEAPAGFEPVVFPEFPWQYFESGTSRAYALDYYDREKRELEAIAGVSVDRRGNTLTLRFDDELLFRFGSANLSAGARGGLRSVADTLAKYPNAAVAVTGHTDSTGSKAYNRRLSRERADVVRDYLIGQGVDANRILAYGLGPSSPVGSNATPEGRAQNRRVEIELQPSVAGGPMTSGWR